jgi:hypothetical protein
MGMGLAMTTVLHFKFGVKQSMLMQAVMQPVAFLDSAVVKNKLLGLLKPGERAYGEKFEGEEMIDDDDDGNEAAAAAEGTDGATAKISGETSGSSGVVEKDERSGSGGDNNDEMPAAESPTQVLSRLIGETWDSGKHADYGPLFGALSPGLVDTKAEDSDATALMVVAAGVGDVTRHVQVCV